MSFLRTLRGILSLRLPLRFLRGARGRLVFALLALASGIALVCALDLVHRAVYRAFVEVIDTMAGRAALQIDTGDSGLFPEELAAQIAALPGVKAAVPVVSATAFTVGETPESLAVHAFDLGDADAVQVYATHDGDGLEVEDPLVFLNQPDSIIIAESYADRRSLKVGSPIELDTSSGRRTFTVRGLLRPTGIARAFDGNLIVMDLLAAEEVFTRRGYVNRVDVVVENDASVSGVAEAIKSVLPAGLRVETPSQRKADLHSVMRSLHVLLQGLGLVALVAAFLIAFTRLSALFEERAWQIGLLRALGGRRRVVWRELLKEGLILGVVGIAVGVPAGVLLGRAILPAVAETTALNSRLIAPQAELSLQPGALVTAVLLGLGAALAAALLPAWRASMINVAGILRGRGQEMPSGAAPLTTIFRVGLALALCLTLAVSITTRDATWSLAATVLLVIGTKSLAAPLVQLILRTVRTHLGERIGSTGRLVVNDLARSPRRTGLSVAMIGIGVGTVIWLAIVAHSFEVTTVEVFEQAMRADLVVSSAHVGAGLLEQPVDDRFAGLLSEIDGVESVVGIRLVNWEYGGGPIVIDTFDPKYFRDPSFGEWPLIGHHLPNAWEAVANGEAVVVSSSFVRNIGLGVGERLTLDTPSGPLSLQVVGVTTDFASPRGTLEMSRALYRRYWNDSTVTRFFVNLVPGSLPGLVSKEIRSRLGVDQERAWRIISGVELVRHFGGQVRRAFGPIYVLTAVILAVVLFGMMDNLSGGIAERTWEIGTLRALGVRRGRLRNIVVAEALVICVLGLAIALFIGLMAGMLWVEATIPGLLGWIIDLRLPLVLVAGVIGITLVSTGLAALPPARQVARMDPAAALRWE